MFTLFESEEAYQGAGKLRDQKPFSWSRGVQGVIQTSFTPKSAFFGEPLNWLSYFLVYQRTKYLVLVITSSFWKAVYLVIGMSSAEFCRRSSSLWETQGLHSAFHKDPLVFGHPQQIHIKWMFTFRNPRCHFITVELTSRLKSFLLLRIHLLKKGIPSKE